MNAKPVAAIERIREWSRGNAWHFAPPRLEAETIVAWADSIPDGAVPVVWPADLTRERLEELAADESTVVAIAGRYSAIRALAAIAPQKKKRVVNLWEGSAGSTCWADSSEDGNLLRYGWKLVARNVELED